MKTHCSMHMLLFIVFGIVNKKFWEESIAYSFDTKRFA
jgi:hypothetical protein